jgi:hypothetical protein
MKSLFFWYLVAIASETYVLSFKSTTSRYQYKHGQGSPLSSKRREYKTFCVNPLHEKQSLLNLSDEILSIIMTKNVFIGSSLNLVTRPGYTFGLGCDKWEASNYAGTIEGWSGDPTIRWISRSLLHELSSETNSKSMDSNAESSKMKEEQSYLDSLPSRLDMHFNVGTSLDVPNMRIAVTSSEQGYSISLDYSPRVELLSSMDYFDKHFQNVEAAHAKALSGGILEGTVTKKIPASVLSRMLQSPFAISVDVKPNGAPFVRDICIEYVKLWCDWLNKATVALIVSEKAPTIDLENLEDLKMFERDSSIQKLLFEEQKFELASFLGVDFAPKAAELAAAIVGPSMGKTSYSLY